MTPQFSNLVLTFMIEHQKAFLLVKRVDSEKNFPGYWAFPGGRALVGETIIDTLGRKISNETGLRLKNRIMFIDSYSFKYSTGLTVLLQSMSRRVKLNPQDATESDWIKSLEQLKKYKRIPGINNHFVAACKALKKPSRWQNLQQLQLTQNLFLNR